MKSKIGLLVFSMCWISYELLSQQMRGDSPMPVANLADPEEYLMLKLKPYGVFLGVKEPANWVGDLVKAGDMYATALFYQSEKSFKSGGVIIKVIVYTKQDDNTLADMEYDMKMFKKEYRHAKTEALNLTHSEYPSFSTLAYIPKKRYEYITYLNPGREFKSGVLVTMRSRKRKANIQEMRIYDEIVRSIHVSTIEDKSIENMMPQYLLPAPPTEIQPSEGDFSTTKN